MCVLGSICLSFFLLRDDLESLKCCLDHWLSCMIDCIHVYVFPFLKNCFKQSRQLLDTSRYLAYLSSSPATFNLNLDCFLIAPQSIGKVYVSSIHRASFWLWTPKDTYSIAASVDPFKARHLSIPLDLLRITKLLYIGLAWFRPHFTRSLLISLD